MNQNENKEMEENQTEIQKQMQKLNQTFTTLMGQVMELAVSYVKQTVFGNARSAKARTVQNKMSNKLKNISTDINNIISQGEQRLKPIKTPEEVYKESRPVLEALSKKWDELTPLVTQIMKEEGAPVKEELIKSLEQITKTAKGEIRKFNPK